MATEIPEMSLHDYLKEIRLDKFEQNLNKKGVHSVRDFETIDQSSLISEVGMNLAQAKYLERRMEVMFPDLVS